MLGRPAWSPRERSERFVEFLDLLDRLLREPTTTYEGQFYSAADARMIPGCVQRPRLPFAVAASGPRGMAVAARLADTWVTDGNAREVGGTAEGCLAEVRRQSEKFTEALAAAGRGTSSVGRLALFGFNAERPLASVEAFRDVVGRYAEVGITDIVVHYPRESEPFAAGIEVLEAGRRRGAAGPARPMTTSDHGSFNVI